MGYFEHMCKDCRYFTPLDHNFKTGKGFDRSNCCIYFCVSGEAEKYNEYVMQVSENNICECFTSREEMCKKNGK